MVVVSKNGGGGCADDGDGCGQGFTGIGRRADGRTRLHKEMRSPIKKRRECGRKKDK